METFFWSGKKTKADRLDDALYKISVYRHLFSDLEIQFILSVREFYSKRKFITQKQIEKVEDTIKKAFDRQY